MMEIKSKMLVKVIEVAIMLMILFCLSSCRSVQSPKPLSPVSTLFYSPGTAHMDSCTPPTPVPGKASICGFLTALYMNLSPIPQTPFYFMAVSDQDKEPVLINPRLEAGDILGLSDSYGRIMLDNLPPGAYHLVVWAPYGWAFAVKSLDDPTPRMFFFSPNQRYILGLIYVQWP